MSGIKMKIISPVLVMVILFFTQLFSQPMPPTPRGERDIITELNLSGIQKEEINKILSCKKDKLDTIRNKVADILKNYRDSSESAFKESDKEILKVLDKEEAERFKSETEGHGHFMMLPPPGRIDLGFSPGGPRLSEANTDLIPPDQFEPGDLPGYPPEPGMQDADEMEHNLEENQNEFSRPNFQDPNSDSENENDWFQDLDVFDLLDFQ